MKAKIVIDSIKEITETEKDLLNDAACRLSSGCGNCPLGTCQDGIEYTFNRWVEAGVIAEESTSPITRKESADTLLVSLQKLNMTSIILQVTPDQLSFYKWLCRQGYISDGITLEPISIIIPKD